MRLVPFLLTVALSAQAPGKLPWDSATSLPWKAGDCGAPLPPRTPRALPSPAPLRVRVTVDGALKVINNRGMILLRTGLPGRPLRMWRDGGVALEEAFGIQPFAAVSPVSRGIGGLPIGARDFRPALEGLLWILCDDGKVITLVHPATARICYLPLPGGRDFRLAFHPDRLEVREAAPGAEECWSLPWLALLPQFIQLGQENPENRPNGTALVPYPKS